MIFIRCFGSFEEHFGAIIFTFLVIWFRCSVVEPSLLQVFCSVKGLIKCEHSIIFFNIHFFGISFFQKNLGNTTLVFRADLKARIFMHKRDEIAQMIEWWTVEPEVSGSNPAAGD